MAEAEVVEAVEVVGVVGVVEAVEVVGVVGVVEAVEEELFMDSRRRWWRGTRGGKLCGGGKQMERYVGKHIGLGSLYFLQ